MSTPERRDELVAVIRACDWLVRILRVVAALDLPDGWVGAGAVRDVVWDERFGSGFDPRAIKDVDVVFFDPTDPDRATEHAAEAQLHAADPTVEWDVKNQARVHLWYEARFGTAVEPLTSTADGVATWPETATCVAVRAEAGDSFVVSAPYGLDDLLDGVWRRNPRRVTDAEYRARLARKSPSTRWPRVRVIS